MGILLLFLFSHFSFAEGSCKTTPENYLALIDCAEARSPEIQIAKLEAEAARKQIGAAGQWRNPEFAVETFSGKVGPDSRSETDISLGIPIELGGKTSARKGIAQGEADLAEVRLFEARARVRSMVYLKLHRLRQVLHEREIIDEAVGTFTKLISQYSRRPGLSPEQRVSASVFQLSKSEYDLKRNANVDEQIALDSFLKLHVGLSADQAKSLLPESPKRWPSFTSATAPKTSARQQLLQAELNSARAELDLAKSESWPTVTLGPSVKLVEESRFNDRLIGFNVSLPLPLFNANGGMRATATANVRTNEAKRQFGLTEIEIQREELLKVYDQSVKSLSTSLSHREIEERHEDSEKLFMRGVVPAALVIEAHRTSFELERARHEREIKALEALLGLYALDGMIMEATL